MRVAVEIELSAADRRRLEQWSRSRSVAVRERSRMVLMAAVGMTNKAIAGEGLDGNAKERHGVVTTAGNARRRKQS